MPKINSVVEKPLSERDIITVLVTSYLSREDGLSAYASAYLRHAALLPSIPLRERIIGLERSSETPEAQDFLISFTKQARKILQTEAWANTMSKSQTKCDLADLIDGRLYTACLQDPNLGTDQHYTVLLGIVNRLNGEKQVANGLANGKTSATQTTSQDQHKAPKRYAVLPFSNDVFEKHLAPIQLVEDRSGEIVDATSALIFREVSHWHNSKRPMDAKIREDQILKTQKQQFFARRRNQWCK